mgnify:CR=1 FL=1|tara:strand:+ start:147 stop:740 length:594 start_codon:yes stop_codon:yes gene_type:complete
MAWYSVGTVTVTNSSAVVTGVGTYFLASVKVGHIFYGPDKNLYEVLSVATDTQLTLNSVYLSATSANSAYAVIPTQGMVPSLVTQIQTLIGDFGTVRDTVGTGKFSAGAANTPGISFIDDQDSGAYLIAPGSWALVCGGLAGVSLSPTASSLNYSNDPKITTSAQGATVSGTLTATELQAGVHTMTNLDSRITALGG